VIQRLSASHRKIQEIELKQIEKERCADLDGEREKLRAACESLQGGRLPIEILKTVEEQLRLL
jgi:hypothetical protein